MCGCISMQLCIIHVPTRTPSYQANPACVPGVNDETHRAVGQNQAIRHSWQIIHLMFANNGCQEDNEQNRQEVSTGLTFFFVSNCSHKTNSHYYLFNYIFLELVHKREDNNL